MATPTSFSSPSSSSPESARSEPVLGQYHHHHKFNFEQQDQIAQTAQATRPSPTASAASASSSSSSSSPWATAEDWAKFRLVITRHYRDENMKLKDLIPFMDRTYDFRAT